MVAIDTQHSRGIRPIASERESRMSEREIRERAREEKERGEKVRKTEKFYLFSDLICSPVSRFGPL